jgi:quinol monooxygenase YgiN
MSMTIFRLARYTIRPEHLEACLAAQREIVINVQATEPGTLHYTVAQNPNDPLSFVHCSAYADQEALERHLQNPYMLERIQTVLQPAMTAPPQFEQYRVLTGAPGLEAV